MKNQTNRKAIKLKEVKATPKSGAEKITYGSTKTNYSLLDFWKWSLSDVLSNATRGRFAEFIVGTAIELDVSNIREEWDAYDLKTTDGIRIEIKSSSYIQSWEQFDYSPIRFSIKATRQWDADDGLSRGKAKRHSDIYVFCVLKHKDQETIDPLKMEQWEFYVVPTFKLDTHEGSQNTISLNSLAKMVQATGYPDLKDQIYKSYDEQLQFQKRHPRGPNTSSGGKPAN